MLNQISSFLVEKSIVAGAFSRKDEELYLYSYQSLLAQTFNWITVLTLGLLFKQLLGALTFMLFFLPLRTFGGGYHERDYRECYLSSLAVYFLIFFVCPWITAMVTPRLQLILLMISGIIIFFRVPVADKNNPLDHKELRRCRWIARVILAADTSIVSLILFVYGSNLVVSFALVAILTVAILLIVPASVKADTM